MQVRIRYMAQLKHAAGVAAETIDVERPCAIADLLQRLATKHGEPFRRIVFDAHNKVQSAILLFVRDQQIHSDAVHAFHEGDELTVLAPMAGG